MIFLEIDLKPVGSVLQHRESCLAESPQGNDTSRKSTGDLLFFQYLLGFLGMEFDQLARTILHFESRAVGCHACFAQGVELLDALLLLLVQVVQDMRLYRSSFLGQQDAEKVRQPRSRIVQTLNVPQRVRLGPSLAAALLNELFEHPAWYSRIAPDAGTIEFPPCHKSLSIACWLFPR